jgi:predicted glycoside hydrolase/deacetylase ChbG (UPF0249 family)
MDSIKKVNSRSCRLIIRAVDMGCSHASNEAILKCYLHGIVTSVEVMVPAPWFPEAVKILKLYPGVDVGVHLTITSEWENIKWRPITYCPSLRDWRGYFFPMVWTNLNYSGQAIVENHWKLQEIESEFRAQIKLARKEIPVISHISAHMGCTDFTSEVRALTQKLAHEYHLLYDDCDDQRIEIHYKGANHTADEKLESFNRMLTELEPGKTYLFIDHPGLDTAELNAYWHIGYETVAADRQGITDVFTNHQVKELIHQKGIKLISFRDLLTTKNSYH